MIARRRTTVIWAAGLAIVLAGWAACRSSEGDNAESMPAASDVSTGYDYAQQACQPVAMSARAAIAGSVSQWPDEPERRMEAMASRLDRVVKAVGTATGTHCIPRIGATDRGVIVGEDGTVEVDATVLWSLDEEGLAALVAHEVAHNILGHKTDMERIRKDREMGLLGSAQRERLLEIAADEFAGRIVAKLHYPPDGFMSAVRRVPGAGGHSASVDQMYSTDQRWIAFQRGYSEGLTTTQPASQHAEE